MTLNRTRKFRRICLLLTGVALGLMIFSKAYVAVGVIPSPVTGRFGIHISDGRVTFFYAPAKVDKMDLPRSQVQRMRVYYDPANIDERSKIERFGRVVIPLWVFLAAAGLPYILLNWRTMVLAGRVRCAECNYDLRHNASGRCPECGSEIDKESEEPLPAGGE